jgi:hypothetical protein
MDCKSGSGVGVKVAGLLDRTNLAAVDIRNLRLQLNTNKDTPHRTLRKHELVVRKNTLELSVKPASDDPTGMMVEAY